MANSPKLRTSMYTCLILTKPVPHTDMYPGLGSFQEPSPSPEPAQWSSAIGHATTTGKSGRVIERLQGDIDRLNREKQLLKVQYEDSQSTVETISTRNEYLQTSNSNYEQSHEADVRQIARKDRQLDELREDLKRQRTRTAAAEESAAVANANEEEWREVASQAKSKALQKELEYDTLNTCRTLDNERNYTMLSKLRKNFEELIHDRNEEQDKLRKLEIIIEQQRETIRTLEGYNKRIHANSQTYQREVDNAIRDVREHVIIQDEVVVAKLAEMQDTIDKMKWVMNVDGELNN